MTPRQKLIALLMVAAGMRLLLAFGGGQYFDWDEYRYGFSTLMLERLRQHDAAGALDILFRYPEHPGFKLIALIPAAFHALAAYDSGHPISDMRYATREWVPAFLLSLTSVGSIGLTYLIARRTGAPEDESVFAALLMWASTSMLMSAQHFFPYDTAMMLLLWAIFLAADRHDSMRIALAAGTLAGAGFVTYEGYWLLAVVAAVVLVSSGSSTFLVLARRGLSFAVGFSLIPVALVAASAARGRRLVSDTLQFSQTVTHGDFSEGWRLPWEYFWNAEHLLLAVVVTGAALTVVKKNGRGIYWLLVTCLVYGGLVLGSTVFHRFVVYDRLARELWPFLCLSAAAGFYGVDGLRRALESRRGQLVMPAALAALLVFNSWPLLTQRYPRDIVATVIAQNGAENLQLDTNILNTVDATSGMFLPLDHPASFAPASPPKRYVLLNARDLWIDGQPGVKDVPAGRLVATWRHPRRWRALQYHGYTAEQREFIRTTDISIRLIDTWK